MKKAGIHPLRTMRPVERVVNVLGMKNLQRGAVGSHDCCMTTARVRGRFLQRKLFTACQPTELGISVCNQLDALLALQAVAVMVTAALTV